MLQSAKRSLASWAQRASPRLWLEFDIARRNRHFEPEFWLLPDLARGGLAIDVGGNAGHFAYYMAKTARRVHVFEPNPACVAQMRPLLRPNMTVHEVALSDRPGTVVLRVDPQNTGVGTIEPANTLEANPGVRSVEMVEVKTAPLDDFGLTGVTLIKIDVEGHEPSVVRGGLRTIAASRPKLLVETETRHNPHGFDELCAMLAPLGYAPWRLSAGKLAPVQPGEIGALQAGGPGPGYVNNFLFLPG